MIILCYRSKKELKENIGKPLNYIETSMFGAEYVENGKITGSNRPYSPEYGDQLSRCYILVNDPKTGLPKKKKCGEFFATVTIKDGLIEKVD